MQQRPGGARLATEIDVSALDRSRELIVTRVREQELKPGRKLSIRVGMTAKSREFALETGDQGS